MLAQRLFLAFVFFSNLHFPEPEDRGSIPRTRIFFFFLLFLICRIFVPFVIFFFYAPPRLCETRLQGFNLAPLS